MSNNKSYSRSLSSTASNDLLDNVDTSRKSASWIPPRSYLDSDLHGRHDDFHVLSPSGDGSDDDTRTAAAYFVTFPPGSSHALHQSVSGDPRSQLSTPDSTMSCDDEHKPFLLRRSAALLGVSLFLMCDYMLLLVIVPIVPHYLKDLGTSSIMVGILFSSKGVLQVLANPIWGSITDKYGHKLPMFTGMAVLFASTITFAYVNTYALLLTARAVQGIASAALMTSGMAFLSAIYPSDERGEAMGSAMSGVGIGVMIGPTLGGLAYVSSPFHRALPFLIVAVLILADMVFLFALFRERDQVHSFHSDRQPLVNPTDDTDVPTLVGIDNRSMMDESIATSQASTWTLIKDPQILSVLIGLVLADTSISLIEPLLPTWLASDFGVSKGLTGLPLLATSLVYAITAPIIGGWGEGRNRRAIQIAGLLIISIALPVMTVMPNIWSLVIILAIMGFGIGVVDASSLPQLADAVEQRYPGSFGAVFSLGDVALSIGYVIGPLLGTGLYHAMRLTFVMLTYSAVAVVYLPALWIYRHDPDSRSGKVQRIKL
jgi:MFS transporter, DHA1 family, solute carrier family 18 (vesicular amine transporter), member 1/2